MLLPRMFRAAACSGSALQHLAPAATNLKTTGFASQIQQQQHVALQQLQSRLLSERAYAVEQQAQQQQAQQLRQRIRELVARSKGESGDASAEALPELSANLSATFQKNRGSLPWPTEGAVTVDFGNQVDPVHGTETYHPGIQIATSPESPVQAIFDGIVSSIDFVPGYGTYVVIRHGEYLSVYSNFSSLSISQSQRVEAGEIIGQAGTENQPRGASLFFGVVNRSTSEFVDPGQWLSAR